MGFELIQLIVGLAGLAVGAEFFVRGAAALGARLGLSRLVIGLTLVAFGTSSPELAVTLGAAITGRADIGVGNVIGSNIANVLLILGITAIVARLAVSREILRFDLPVMLGASVMLYAFAWNGRISAIEGGFLLLALIAYGWSLFTRRRAPEERGDLLPDAAAFSWFGVAWRLVGGLALLVGGSNWLVEGAAALARAIGVSEIVIGLSVVAIGTSLPELATSVVAVARGEREMVIGNVLGSNVLNILLVVGATSVLADGNGLTVAADALRLHLPIMMAVALLCVPVFVVSRTILRWEGLLLFGYYGLYIAYLYLEATGSAATGLFQLVALGFVISMTALMLVLGLLGGRATRKSRA